MSIMDTVGGGHVNNGYCWWGWGHVNKLAVYTHVCSTSYNWDSW